ncbi:glycosyltransferase [Aliiroseovarius crassostreae]|uniref:glycosyltransferase n=1 Tax=Aliiroseovarius crassostreae TaxID=154981 RepID=UPI0021FA32E4|nr:glycosyltransferase [Aliiroseovarius crassostreae]UWQ04610.1 glycosyltransferase [Aliiroseovarius crassostreae]
MKLLFIHQNFPGQFVHLAPELVRQGHDCVALTLRVKEARVWKGVKVLPYQLDVPKNATQPHPWLTNTNTHLIRAHSFFKAALRLRDQGFNPDVIVAHPGWGESLFVKDVWPDARLGLFCEFYNGPEQAAFEGEVTADDVLRLRMKNITNHLHFAIGDAGLSPTRFQADSFPAAFRDKIHVIHDGIRTDQLVHDETVTFQAENTPRLTRQDEVITFVNRNLEPYRGYHIFMRALPQILRDRPKAQVLITGGDDTSYGARPPEGQTWKQIYIDEVRDQISDADWARVHFLGRIPYDQFTRMLQVSRVHVYLTYPFVLSWSLLEAMSVEAAIVASRTEPVEEVLQDGKSARLFDFHNPQDLADNIITLLDDPDQRTRLGQAARAEVVENYDLLTICQPRLINWVQHLYDMPANPPEHVAR